MLKIKGLLKDLIETQKQINENIKKLNETKMKITDKLNTTSCIIDKLDTCITTNIYTKDQTTEMINKEYDYRKKLEECETKNKDLLELIAKYGKYNDKYEVLEMFSKMDAEYIVTKLEEK